MIPEAQPPMGAVIGFEVGIYLLAAVYTVYAWRWGGAYYGFLIPVLVVYAYVSEVIAIRFTGNYYYCHVFALNLCGSSPVTTATCSIPTFCVPLVIPFAEAVIFFTVMRTSDLLRPGSWARPFLDAVMATNIDVIFDPVVAHATSCGASAPMRHGLGFWTWILHPSDPGLWFGIPLNNYFAWLAAIAGFSASMRWVQGHFGVNWMRLEKRHPLETLGLLLLTAVIGLIVGGIVILVLSYPFTHFPSNAWRWAFFLALLVVALWLASSAAHSPHIRHRVEWPLIAGHAFFFLFALGAILGSGRAGEEPSILVVWLVTATVGTLFVLRPYWERMRGRVAA